MKYVRNQRRSGATVDLIPMIDVVFQLILFFLVSTTFSVLPGISLNLPTSQTAQSEAAGSITITMKDDGSLFYNSETVDLALLDARLADFDAVEYEKRLEYPVTLQADSLVTNGAIVGIFDVLRKNGFSAVNLRTNINE
ncbi:MAG: biopolymer transporter ExbD [Treponemataceae bacterium]|nr:biopolymer transporter ExbD [Treponemataceae bacterium]